MRLWFPIAKDVLENVRRTINTSCLLSNDRNLIRIIPLSACVERRTQRIQCLASVSLFCFHLTFGI